MGSRRPFLVVIMAALSGAIATALPAQTPQQRTLTGRVTDAPTGQPLANAQIANVGTNLGAQTNSDGQYTIRSIPPGAFQIRALRVGYGEMRRPVTIAAGQTATENFQM